MTGNVSLSKSAGNLNNVLLSAEGTILGNLLRAPRRQSGPLARTRQLEKKWLSMAIMVPPTSCDWQTLPVQTLPTRRATSSSSSGCTNDTRPSRQGCRVLACRDHRASQWHGSSVSSPHSCAASCAALRVTSRSTRLTYYVGGGANTLRWGFAFPGSAACAASSLFSRA